MDFFFYINKTHFNFTILQIVLLLCVIQTFAMLPIIVISIGIGCFMLFGVLVFRSKVVSKKLPSVQLIRTLYEKNKDNGELYKFTWNKKTAVLLMDLNLIKDVLIKNFRKFERRDDFFDENDDFKRSHLANVYGEKWEILRKRLSKSFYSCAMEDVIRDFKTFYWSPAENMFETVNEICDVTDLMYSWSFRGIMNVAFGAEHSSIVKSTFDFLFAPHKKKTNEKEFFLKKIQELENNRTQKKSPDKMFLKMLLDLKNEDLISSVDVAAQTYIFCSAGSESVALTALYCLYELAMNSDIQNRLRTEVTEVLFNNDNTLTKKVLDEMVFLNCCVRGKS